LSSGTGIAPAVVVILIGVIVVAALIWATGRLARDRRIWLPAASLTAVGVLLLIYSWQGSAPSAETEIMRSQVLRRLGHNSVAEQIEKSLLEAEMPGRD
jgi:hypothetical protein